MQAMLRGCFATAALVAWGWAGGCAESEPGVAPTRSCQTPDLQGYPCGTVGDSCVCSGYECPTYVDGFCTAVCSEVGVWKLTDCKRALSPGSGGQGGEGGEGGAAGQAGATP
jgi:hypothetical protein